MKPGTFFEIPRDNFFHACLLMKEIIRSLEDGFEKAQFDARTLSVSRLSDEVHSVVALLADTLLDRENREVAKYLSRNLKIEYEDGVLFDPATRAPLGTEPTIKIPKKVYLAALAYLLAYDRQDLDVDLDRFFPNKEMHHMVLAQVHGSLFITESHAHLTAFINARGARSKASRTYKREHGEDVVVDIWDFPS